MTDTSLVICPQDSPNRCQSITSKGQCVNLAQEGSTCCSMHHRVAAPAAARKSVTDMYECHQKQRIREFAAAGGPSGIMSLSAEVSILRMTLETILNSCETSNQLVCNIGPISDITSKIAGVLSIMDRINMNSGNLLGPEEIVQIAQDIIAAIAHEVSDPKTQQRLAIAIGQIIQNKFAPGTVV